MNNAIKSIERRVQYWPVIKNILSLYSQVKAKIKGDEK